MSYSNVQSGTPGALTSTTFSGTVPTDGSPEALDTGMAIESGGVLVTFSLVAQNSSRTRTYNVIAAVHSTANPKATVNEFSQDNGDDISDGIASLDASVDGSNHLIITVNTNQTQVLETYDVVGFAILAGTQP